MKKTIFGITLFTIILIIGQSTVSQEILTEKIKTFNFHDKFVIPEDLQIGDLLFIESIAFFHNIRGSWDHVAMHIGNNLFVEANNYSEIPIFGRKNGVQITPLWRFKLWTQYWAFGKVKTANNDQRESAVKWALSQIGKDNYQVSWGDSSWWANSNPNDQTDPNSNKWYCAELIWASYYNISNGIINLDISPGPLQPPRGDGIHLSVNPQAIASHNDIIIYNQKNAPATPVKPYGNPIYATFPQIGRYYTYSNDLSDKDLYFQWVWGDSFSPEIKWDFTPKGNNKTVIKHHSWDRINIHDKHEYNFVFDVRVRCMDKNGWISNWSDPLPVDVSPYWLKGDWLNPSDYIDTEWINEKGAIDKNSHVTSSIYKKNNDLGWSDNPLIFKFDEPVIIKGFKYKANKGLFHNQMKISFYKDSKLIITFNYTNWPSYRYKIVDFHRYYYEINKIEILFKIDETKFDIDFFRYPVKIYDFKVWLYC